jgi:hypothetical protein
MNKDVTAVESLPTWPLLRSCVSAVLLVLLMHRLLMNDATTDSAAAWVSWAVHFVAAVVLLAGIVLELRRGLTRWLLTIAERRSRL